MDTQSSAASPSRLRAMPACSSREWALQPLLPPETLHPCVIDGPAPHPPPKAVGHPPAPADVFSGDLTEALAQLGLLDVDDLAPHGARCCGFAPPPGRKAFRRPVQACRNATALQRRSGLRSFSRLGLGASLSPRRPQPEAS